MRAFQRDLGVDQLRVHLIGDGLLGGEISFERPALQPVQHIAFLDLGAVLEVDLFEKGGHARDNVHAIDRLNPADELIGFRDRLALDPRDAHGRRSGRGPLRECACVERDGGEDDEGAGSKESQDFASRA